MESRNKALGKTLFHFFWGRVSGLQKNESVFCAVAKIFEGWLFLIKLFSAVAFKVVSVVVISRQKKLIKSPSVQS